MFHVFYITFVFLPSLMVVTRGPGLQHNSLKKIHLIGAILAGKNVAQSAHLIGILYSTAIDIWKNTIPSGQPKPPSFQPGPAILG
jgi:hypothetical protein